MLNTYLSSYLCLYLTVLVELQQKKRINQFQTKKLHRIKWRLAARSQWVKVERELKPIATFQLLQKHWAWTRSSQWLVADWPGSNFHVSQVTHRLIHPSMKGGFYEASNIADDQEHVGMWSLLKMLFWVFVELHYFGNIRTGDTQQNRFRHCSTLVLQILIHGLLYVLLETWNHIRRSPSSGTQTP